MCCGLWRNIPLGIDRSVTNNHHHYNPPFLILPCGRIGKGDFEPKEIYEQRIRLLEKLLYEVNPNDREKIEYYKRVLEAEKSLGPNRINENAVSRLVGNL